MMNRDIHFFRAEAEREAADQAHCVEAANAHRALAELHLARALETEATTSVDTGRRNLESPS